MPILCPRWTPGHGSFKQRLLADSLISREAFSTLYGLYQFVTLPFGLFGAPATFQRLMDRVLRPHAAYAAAYLDDVIIHSDS